MGKKNCWRSDEILSSSALLDRIVLGMEREREKDIL